jgi:hypothetical protein
LSVNFMAIVNEILRINDGYIVSLRVVALKVLFSSLS